MNSKKNNNTKIDLLNDEDFIQWMVSPPSEASVYWHELINSKYPEQKKILISLIQLMENVDSDEKGLSSEERDKMWSTIKELCKKKENRQVNYFLIRSIAASILILLLVSTYFFLDKQYFKQDSKNRIDYDIVALQARQKKKSSENVVLILSNQEKVEIENKDVELVYDKKGNVVINEEKKYTDSPSTHSNKITYNQLITPDGKNSTIVLNDGSKIWINSGSLLIYPTSFPENKREVYIDGEIYLEVAKDSNKTPFIVKTANLEIEVLGTSFNVSAYKNDANQSVVLATGSVSIRKIKDKKNTVVIKPNQKYRYDIENDRIDLENIDVYDYTCWRFGFLHFKSEKLSSVLQKLERYYNVNIHYSPGKVNDILVSGKLDLKESLEDVIKTIAFTAPIQYEIKNNLVNINVKP